MKIHLGTDICELQRIQSIFEKYGKKFLNKTYTQAEIDYCLSTPHHTYSRLAVRFATKEAVSKALGVGLNGLGWSKGVDWKDIELIRNDKGAISLELYDKAKKIAQESGITNWAVSVSHSKSNAISTVIGYTE